MSEHLETRFLETPWTLILGADSTIESTRALTKLCESYRYPIYAFIRKKTGNIDEARDFTQDFFAHFIEKEIYKKAHPDRGRFRTFLLACVGNFLKQKHRNEQTDKRKITSRVTMDLSLAEQLEEEQISHHHSPEHLFEKACANSTFDQVWTDLAAEYEAAGEKNRFEQLRPILMMEDSNETYLEIAKKLKITESGVKSAVFRMRRRFRELFRARVATMVQHPDDVDDEIAHLVRMIREV